MSYHRKILGKISDSNEKKVAEDRLFESLKRHIIREREKKKQLEAETLKEEQLRNEREARKKQDKQTLGKTQAEIARLEEQLVLLKDKKHSLFLQLKALITREVEQEKIRKENDISRNDVGSYATYNVGDKGGVKRPRSPVPQSDFYKNASPSPGVYLPPKPDTGRHETRRAVLWYNPAKYGSSQQGWPMTTRYPIPQNVPAPHILHLNTEHQQPPPQLVKQAQPPPKSNTISIEKVGDPMRKVPAPQQDFTIHRRPAPTQPQNPYIRYE